MPIPHPADPGMKARREEKKGGKGREDEGKVFRFGTKKRKSIGPTTKLNVGRICS